MRNPVRNGLLFAIFLATAFLTHAHLRNSSPLYNFFFSPDDLYSTLAEATFDLSAQGMEKELSFTAKYPGNHQLAILVESPLVPPAEYPSDFEVKVQVTGGAGLLSESLISDANSWFYGGQSHSGFALVTYRVPVDFPLGEMISIRVTVIEASPDFEVEYGAQRIIVSKTSDE